MIHTACFPKFSRTTALVGMLLPWVSTWAQVSEQSPPDSRLRQMESIYQQQLKARHIPILSQYLTELQKQVVKSSDPKPIQEEIQRIQALISAGGGVDLLNVVRELHPEAVPTLPKPVPEATRRGPLTLTPAFAQSIRPLPESSSSPEAAAIGEIQWRIDSLPAGSYDLVLQYSCPKLDHDLVLQVSFAGQIITQKLEPTRAGKTNTGYRLIRLGPLKIAETASGEILRLSTGAPDSAEVLLRSFVISRTKPVKADD